jgi:drug/metabolite transporter (DMT)-like permease
MRINSRLSLAVALLVILVWGTNFAILKFLLAQISPGALLFARFLVAALCALVLLVALYGLRWPRLDVSEWWQIARLTLLGQVVHVGLIIHGISLSTAFASALISACGPIFTLLTVRLLEPYRFERTQLIGVVVALMGVLLFLSNRMMGQLTHSQGDILLLIATVLFSIYSVIAKPVLARQGPALVSSYGALLALVPMMAVYAGSAIATPWSTLSVLTWALLTWSLVVSAFAGWLVWSWVNNIRGVARSAPLLYLLPLVAGLTAWLWLGETFTLVQIVGAALALAGVAAAQYGRFNISLDLVVPPKKQEIEK